MNCIGDSEQKVPKRRNEVDWEQKMSIVFKNKSYWRVLKMLLYKKC